MAGQLDSAFKQIAKQIVSDLGSSLDTTITFIKKGQLQYNVATGQQVSVDTTFTSVPTVMTPSARLALCIPYRELRR